MQKMLSRLFTAGEKPEPLAPGIYHKMIPENAENPNRLHLRIEADGRGLLLLNAATVLHLNPTAAEHIYFWLAGHSEGEAAQKIARRYRVSQAKAFSNQHRLRDQVMQLAETPGLDPVLFIGLERSEPYSDSPPAPYRLDCALTYKMDSKGAYDPLARARVDKELSQGEWQTVLTKAWDAGIPHITFTGGEPCLRDDLPALIAHCETLGQVTGLLTNGVRLADESYLHELYQAGLDHMLISYTPGDRASKKGLDAALSKDLFISVHATLNEDSSTSMLDELAAKGVKSISLSMQDSKVGSVLQDFHNHAAHIGLDLVWDLPVPFSRHNPLSLELEGQHRGDGRAWLYVEPDADVLPSQGIDKILGNILTDSWEDIWGHAQTWYVEQD